MRPAPLSGCYDGAFMKRLSFLLLIVALAGCGKTTPAASGTSTAATKPAVAAKAASAPAEAPAGPAASATPAAPALPKPMPAQIPAVLARVNGEAIEKWEFDNAIKAVEQRAGGPVPAERRDEILRGVLDQLVTLHLLAQESKGRKIEVTDADIDGQIAQIKKGYPDEEAFNKDVAAQGMTVPQLKSQTRQRLLAQKLVESPDVTGGVLVGDAEVDGFYKQNPDRFKQPESVHASHILIGLPQNPTPAQKAQARAAAQDTLNKIKGGGDFATLARERSNDSSAQNGGDLGFVPRGQTVAPFEEAAFKLKPGAVSGIVETQFGFHIIKAHEHRAARTVPFAEVSGQIKQFLEQQQKEAKLQKFVEATKSKAKIEMMV
jgi:peptidyl-prolyl cis-trans isomerase C